MSDSHPKRRQDFAAKSAGEVCVGLGVCSLRDKEVQQSQNYSFCQDKENIMSSGFKLCSELFTAFLYKLCASKLHGKLCCIRFIRHCFTNECIIYSLHTLVVVTYLIATVALGQIALHSLSGH